MKYKILYITLFPHIGGGETALFYLLSKLDKSKFEPIVIVPEKGQVVDRLKKMKIKTYILPLKGFLIRIFFVPGMSPMGIIRLFRFCKKYKPTIIHINHPFLAVYAGIVGKWLHIPVIATSHGLWDCVYLYQDIINRMCIDLMLPITSEVQKGITHRGIMPFKKTRVIQLGVDTNIFVPSKDKSIAKQKLGITPQNTVVTMACRFDFTKNHITFLKTAGKIIDTLKHVTFLIVGDISHNLENKTAMARKVKKQLDEYLNLHKDLQKHVVFTDYQENMVPIYQATDILFSSSLSETLPVSYLEGASCGLPLIAIQNTSTHKIIHHKKNGYLAKKENITVLSNYLLLLLRDKTKRKTFGAYSRNLVLNEYSLTTYTQNLESEYIKRISTQ